MIFDFDGVVADSEMLHYRAFNAAFEPFSVHIDEQTYYDRYLGYSDVDGIEAIAADCKLELSDTARSELLASKERQFEMIAANDTFIIDGVSEFISMLKADGVRIAVCSGALRSEILMMLGKSDFADAFETIVSADDVAKGKPDPQPYLLTLERLNGREPITAGQCIVIEDSFWGLISAKAAGMHPVAVTNTYPEDKLAADAEKVVKSLSELRIEDLRQICSE